MEELSLLEEKIVKLASAVKELRKKNLELEEENGELKDELAMVQESKSQKAKGIDQLQQERELTRTAIDDLISSIDSITSECENPDVSE